jgi:hypothetical protein
LFGPKSGGAWPSGVSLVGPTGSTGQTGATGPAGANGLDGKSVLNGTSNPTTSLGANGDFYINTGTNTLFGPKTVSGWGTGAKLSNILYSGPGLVIRNDTISLNSSISTDPTANPVRIGFDNSTSWACPQGVNQIIVELWGAGGESSSGGGIWCGSGTCYGGFGGKGGYNKQLVSVVPGQTYAITVGKRGQGGTNNCRVANGGSSSFNGVIIAQGGQGGVLINCSCCATFPKNGTDGQINNFNHPSAVLVPTSYIPQGYITNNYPTQAQATTDGFVVISY